MSAGVGGPGGTSVLNVSGAGSAVVINGDTGFINVGRNGGNATLNITSGGQVRSDDANGLVFMNVGRVGSHGTIFVDGTGSSLTLSGVGGLHSGSDNAGAFLTLGRDAGGVAVATVTNGGSILVSDGGQAATNGSVGIRLGRDAGSSGTLTVSGPTSQVTIEQTGAGTSVPFLDVGRLGTGVMTVTNGAKVAVNGTLERDIYVGSFVAPDPANAVVGGGGNGTLNVTAGAQISASWFGVGLGDSGVGGTGTATINNATVKLDGHAVNPVDNSLFGASVRVGRGDGSTGTLNLETGAKIVIDTTYANAGVSIGGTSAHPGGDGTLNMSGASSISFIGTGLTPSVTIGHSGTGLMTMTEGSALNQPSDGAIYLGKTSTGTGTLAVGGSTITTGSLIVGDAGGGVFNQSSGTTSATSLIAGNQSTGNGAVNLSGAALNVSGNVQIGKAGTGVFDQTGGTTSVGGNVIVGAGNSSVAGAPGGTGSFTQTGGSVTIGSVAIPGDLTIGQGSGAGASAGGTGEYVLHGGSLTVTGQTIVGGGGADSSLGGIGTLFVLDGATMNAGSLLGIGHDGTTSNGAKGTVILDGGANIFATSLAIGAGGCLGGNGTVHTNVVMAGDTIGDCNTGVTPIFTTLANGPGTGVGIEGFLKPGRSPGRLVIDGGFDFISGTIVLDVQADPNAPGGFLTDELVFTSNSNTAFDPLDLAGLNIVYAFLGDTNPDAFNATGDWVLDTFFKINTSADPSAPAGDQDISTLKDAQGNPVPIGTLFAGSTYDAQSSAYVFDSFAFSATEGVTALDAVRIPPETTVPEPGTLWLMLLGSLLLLRSAAMRRPAAPSRRA